MAAEATPDRFASVHALLAEYDVLEKEMADPSIHADQGKARGNGKDMQSYQNGQVTQVHIR